jgi:secondary thiamine-phosphate synthase enzyme
VNDPAYNRPMQSTTFQVTTHAREEIIVITRQVEAALKDLGTNDGFCLISTPHTTAAIAINENADPDVPSDLIRALRAMVPQVRFDHGEGNSDAHLLSALIGPSELLPLRGGKLALGTWQGIYLVELDGPRRRTVAVDVLG